MPLEINYHLKALSYFLVNIWTQYTQMLVIICYLKLIIIIWERLHQVGSVHLPIFQSLHKVGHHTCLLQLIKCDGFWEYKRDFRWPFKKKSQVLKKSGDFGGYGMSPKHDINFSSWESGNICKHTMLSHPLLHGYRNNLKFQGQSTIARFSPSPTGLVLLV